MKLNEATIKHHRSEMIPTRELKNKVALNEAYLREKPTWYEIDGKLQYFKVRNDFRLFTELFFSRFAKEIMDLDSLDYKISYIRTKKPSIPQSKEETKCGLLSTNFQDPNYNHYLISELMRSEISDFITYGGYTLENLLNFFKDYLTKEDYKQNELFLIKLFISDGFTYHVDRNPNNISFRIPKINQTSYKDRLHIEKLKKNPNNNGALKYDNEQERYLITGLTPDVVFDSERILGVDHKNVKTFNETDCWTPLFPYNKSVDFSEMENPQAQEIRNRDFDGFDPNLLSLYMEHQDICKPYFERLAYDDEYRRILEDFTTSSGSISLSNIDTEYVTNVLQNRQQEFRKILKF